MIHHHPSEDILSAYASGALEKGAALVVACHIDRCCDCRRNRAFWDGVGGTLLDNASPLALSEGALDRALKNIGKADAKPIPAAPLPPYLARFNLPGRLRKQTIAPRRWLTPAIWFAPIDTARQGRSCTYLVYARKNTTLPRHTHENREFTAVLSGGYRDTLGAFDAGDFVETDPTVLHAPGITDDAECLCLIASDGPMKLEGFVARLIQRYAGELY